MNLVDLLGGEIGPRPAGSEAARRAAEAVASAFLDLGVAPSFQEFPFLAYAADGALARGRRRRLARRPCDVRAVGECRGHDPPDRDARRPAWPLRARQPSPSSRMAARSRASTAIPLGGGPTPFPTGYGPTLTGPGVYISAADAERLRDGAHVRLRCDGRFDPVTERNVLAELPGEDDETVIVCAHYDSAWRAGGAVDNASGVEGVRRIVERLVGRRRRRTLVAAAFGAEELGLSGARFFVHEASSAASSAGSRLSSTSSVSRAESGSSCGRLRRRCRSEAFGSRRSSASATCRHGRPSRGAITFRSPAKASPRRASSAGRIPSTTCRPTIPTIADEALLEARGRARDAARRGVARLDGESVDGRDCVPSSVAAASTSLG